MVEDAARHHHVFVHGEPDSGLLLVAQQRQVGVEQVVRRVAFARSLDGPRIRLIPPSP